jgi:hypothetical protein
MTKLVAGYDPSDMTGVQIGADPQRTLNHQLRFIWNRVKGCVCAGVFTQGATHSICVGLAVFQGAASSGLGKAASGYLSGTMMGIPTMAAIQYGIVPAVALPLSYAIDKLRNGKYEWWKPVITLSICFATASGLNAVSPHNHSLHSEKDYQIAREFFERLPKEEQAEYLRLSKQNNKPIEVMTLELQPQICTTTPIAPQKDLNLK